MKSRLQNKEMCGAVVLANSSVRYQVLGNEKRLPISDTFIYRSMEIEF